MTDFKYIQSYFNHDHLIYFEQPSVSKSFLLNSYQHEFEYCYQRLTDISSHYNIEISSSDLPTIEDHFVRMISRYHSVKTLFEHHKEISMMFLCPTEGFLIDLAKKAEVKTIFLEHAPNFFPTQLLGNSSQHFIPFHTQLPDYIVSENNITSLFWNNLIDQQQSNTQLINSGLPLDSSNYKLTSPPATNPPHLTITIFNTWLHPTSPEQVLKGPLQLLDLMDNLFESLSLLQKRHGIYIILKNHPEIESNAYQNETFYLDLGEKYKLRNFSIMNDFSTALTTCDIALVLNASSVLTDLLYLKIPSIIYKLNPLSDLSQNDEINELFPSVSSIESLQTLLENFCAIPKSLENEKIKMTEILARYNVKPKSLNQKCNDLINQLNIISP
ncbi:MAG: hypothetical protein VW397_05205 [Candidatus Margulisiibacteriota bacterium]